MGEMSLMQIALSRADFVLVVFENLNLPSPSSGHSSLRKMVSLLLPQILHSMSYFCGAPGASQLKGTFVGVTDFSCQCNIPAQNYSKNIS